MAGGGRPGASNQLSKAHQWCDLAVFKAKIRSFHDDLTLKLLLKSQTKVTENAERDRL